MKRRITRGEWGLLLLALAMIAAVFATGVLDKQKTWTDVPLSYQENRKSFSLEAGDAHGVVAWGPYFDLPEGDYRIKWQMEGDGVNRIRIVSYNDVEITPSEILTSPDAWEDEAAFTVHGPARDVSILVEFASGTVLNLYNFRLYSPMYRDRAFTFAALLLGGWLLLVLFRKTAQPQRWRETLVILGVAVAFASLPALQEDCVRGYDFQYHTLRIMNLADGLANGQFPVRVGGFSYNGYGALTSVYYPDLLLYPFALMVMGGASLSYVVNVMIIAINALSAAAMYRAARRLYGSHSMALCAAVLFVCSIFRIRRIYETLMLGCLLAMAFMPLFFRELWEAVRGNGRRWVHLALSATLIFQSHLLSAAFCAVVAAALCACFLPGMIRERRLGGVCKALGLALLLNAFTLLPMLMYYTGGANTPVMRFDFECVALKTYELLLLDNHVGLALLLGLAALLLAAGRERDSGGDAARIFAVGGVICMLLSTRLTPWSHARLLIGGLMDTMQFPWRLLSLTAVFLSLSGGYAYARLFAGKGVQTAMGLLALSIVSIAGYVTQGAFVNGVLEFGQGADTYITNPEYQIQGTDVEDTLSRQVIIEGDAQLTQYEKRGTQITAQVDAAGDASLSFPLFGFDGYAAELNGEPAAWRLGANNRLTLDVPAGTAGTLNVRFRGKAIWRVTDAISLMTALCTAAYCCKRRKSL